MTKDRKIIYVLGGERRDPVRLKTEIIYKTKNGDWAVTRVIGYKYSAISYEGSIPEYYGLKIGYYKPIYYKGVEYSSKGLTQKELIEECKKLNKFKVDPNKLRMLSVEDREKVKRREFNYENMQ